MKPLRVFALATLFTLGSGTSLFAQQPHLTSPTLPQPAVPIPEIDPAKDFVDAIITEINHRQGLLTLDTEIGVMQVRLAPEETRNLHVGDKLQVQVLSTDRLMAQF
jgi:hypothetical protein